MWSPFLDPQLHLCSASRGGLRGFGQELAHFAVHHEPDKTVLWCDGDHGFDPYDFAETNLQRGLAADDGADRVLVKRCMTAFNWELAIDQHLPEKLETTDVSLVVLAPYDALYTHEELADWEQEDYVRASLRHLRRVAKRHRVPILALVDLHRLWRTHPTLAQAMVETAQAHWAVDRPDGRWRAVEQGTGVVVDPWLRRQVTLLDYVEEDAREVTPTPVLSPRSRKHSHALRR